MFRQTAFILTALVVGHSAPSARSQQAFFMGLGDLPGGSSFSWPWNISVDGTVVVGWSSSSVGIDHFRWTREAGMVGIGIVNNYSPNVSADGSTVVGGQKIGTCPACYSESYQWTSAKGVVPIPLDIGWLSTSADGSIVAGRGPSPTPGQTNAALWTEAGGVEYLPLPDNYADIVDISADGSVILGRLTAGPWSPYTWSAADGTILLDLPSPLSTDGTYLKISDNGKVVASIMGDGNDRRGFRWTKETGAIELGRLPDGPWASATGVSADGSIIVGNTQGVPEIEKRPTIWDAVHGPRYLTDVLVNELGLGHALAGWNLNIATGFSGDGRNVIGYGTNPQGNQEAWIAYLGSPVPEPSSCALTVIGLAAVVSLCCTRRRT